MIIADPDTMSIERIVQSVGRFSRPDNKHSSVEIHLLAGGEVSANADVAMLELAHIINGI